jgi:nitrite reductase/ring-hydroxylating ferredoxin subunit
MFTETGISHSTLTHKGRMVWRKDGKQILLIAAGARVFAIANRCPHEGYPLSEGTLGERTLGESTPGGSCVLTCNWHNWKFDLASGAALIGRDPVRTYPVELRGDAILVDLTDPPAEARRARALQGLSMALTYNDRAHMAREVARLERAGFDATLAITAAMIACNDRLEDGMTHAHAAAADWLTLSQRAQTPAQRLAALLEPLGHLAWDSAGGGHFPYPDGRIDWNGAAFLSAVEGEDEARAIAHMRGALADNVPYTELRPALARAALSHYADFGHSAIYVFKTGQLLARLGDGAREPLLLSLTRSIVRATREEHVPEFRGLATARKAWNGGGASPSAEDFKGASIDHALELTVAGAACDPYILHETLLQAAAWNMLHYDPAWEYASEGALADNVSWFDFTHALTFANAARHLCAETPELWPDALLQMALFVGRNKKYVTPEQDVSHWRVNDRAAFLTSALEGLYDHGLPEPIIACHRLKVLFALEDELRAAPDAAWAGNMFAAVNRYLNTPVKRHHGLRVATQALDFIAREG